VNDRKYKPPYTISDKIVNLISSITELITTMAISDGMNSNPRLRRENRVKTIQASLAIENNTMTTEQVTDIINGKRVLGAPKEICEVKNAFEAYEKLLLLSPHNIDDLLYAHKILMRDLTNEAGMFRNSGVGIYAGDVLVHAAPPAVHVPSLIKDLFDWIMEDYEVHPLIKSCVFHYEFEFIHPFADGNGRMGRMWQTLLLHHWQPLFAWLPIETLIKEKQDDYYKVLGECDKASDSGLFIEYMLTIIWNSLKEISKTEQVTEQATEQVEKLVKAIGDEILSSNELMEKLGLKHRPTFRDNYLLPAIKLGYIEMTIPDKPRSSKQKYKKTNYKLNI